MGVPADFGSSFPTSAEEDTAPVPPNLTKPESEVWARTYTEAMQGECAQNGIDDPHACASNKAWVAVRQHREHSPEGPNALSPEEKAVTHHDYYTDRREFSTEEREKLAEEGKALSHGGFPIENCTDVGNAVQAIGRAKDRSATIRHIIKHAKRLGCMERIPAKWLNGGSAAKSHVPVSRVSDAWIDRTAMRASDAMGDELITTQVPGTTVIDRPDYVSSNVWRNLSLNERTLDAELERRQVERNYHQAVDNMVMNGWVARRIPLNDHEFAFSRYRQTDRGLLLERAILVRQPAETQWHPWIVSRGASSSLAVQTEADAVRYKPWGQE